MWLKNFVRNNLFFLYPFSAFVFVGASLLYLYPKDVLLLAVNSRYSSAADIFFKYYTHMGDGNMYLALTAACLLFFSKGKAAMMALAYASTSIPVQIVKNFLFQPSHRPRAFFWTDYHRLHFVDGVDILVANSFPSGHSAAAFSMFLMFSYFSNNKWASALFFVMAFLAGYSRMYLAQHFFADVYGGALIAVAITTLIIYLAETRWHWNQRWQEGLLKR